MNAFLGTRDARESSTTRRRCRDAYAGDLCARLTWEEFRRRTWAYTSCCGYDRGPRGVEPRGACRYLQSSWEGVSLSGRRSHKPESHAMRQVPSMRDVMW